MFPGIRELSVDIAKHAPVELGPGRDLLEIEVMQTGKAGNARELQITAENPVGMSSFNSEYNDYRCKFTSYCFKCAYASIYSLTNQSEVG